MAEIQDHVVVEQLLSVLDEALCGSTGPTTYFVDNRPDCGLLGSLAALGAADASRPVAGSSVAAHVGHVVFAMDASACWMAGDTAPRDWSASWRVTAVDDEEWAALLERLGREYRNLRAAIESEAGAGGDGFGEAVGAIAHVAYHLGSVRQKLAALGISRGTDTT
jgi:hypothetical protein